MNKADLLQKLLNLAEQGVGGEAENAKELAKQIASKYNIDLNEYKRIAIPKLNAAKRRVMNIAAIMCGCLLLKRGYHWYLLGKHCNLALDCYYYLCGLVPKEHRKDSSFIHGFASGLYERMRDEPGWVDGEKEVQVIIDTLEPKALSRNYKGTMEGYEEAMKANLHRQADNKTKLLTN